MLLTILASIGLYVVVIFVYKKGKKDGITDAIDFFITEMKKREIDTKSLIIDEEFEQLEKSKKINLLPFFNRRKKNE